MAVIHCPFGENFTLAMVNTSLNNKEYFHMYHCQLKFAMSLARSALGLSWQHLYHPNSLLRAVYIFQVYFYVRLVLHGLGVSLSHEDG